MEFEQIYNTYFKAVYRYIWQLSGNEHIAEEITGETFFKAMKSINNFRGECDMRVWLCQIAKNTYFSYLKKNGKIESIDEAKFQNIDSKTEDIVNDKNEICGQKITLYNLQYHNNFSQKNNLISWGSPTNTKAKYMELVVELGNDTLRISNAE